MSVVLNMIPTMIDIDDKIVSSDILTVRFACDLATCKGACCVEGNAGAPLEDAEIDILEEEYGAYREYMTPEGIAAVEEQGFVVVDPDGDYTTPLVDDAECAFCFTEDGIAFCAIEKAYREGKTTFAKPVSCHLYPIRVKKFGNGTFGLNYHRWNICSPACRSGEDKGMRVYQSLREPIIRRFGADFYEALDAAAKYIDQL